MSPHLGLVCLTEDGTISFRSMTKTRLDRLADDAAGEALRGVWLDNVRTLERALAYCAANRIRLYRLVSGVLPFVDLPVGQRLLPRFRDDLRAIGRLALRSRIRLVSHPEQFVVLSSERPEVVANARVALDGEARVFDALGLPVSPWAAMTIHGGKGGRGAALVEAIRGLPDNVRRRLTLENDERAYSAAQIYEVCCAAGVPMVFDAHHHVVHEGLTSYDDPSVAMWTERARSTWPDPAWQLVHISNGRERFGDARHSDVITAMPSAFRDVPWIEVEAKAKERAIFALRGSGGWA